MHTEQGPSARALVLAARFRWALVVLALVAAVMGVLLGTGTLGAHEAHRTYTCPMHPEIHASRPGQCPICQMDLVPTADVAPEHAARVKLVCPDHPEIRSDVPGVCPLDGRRLVPAGVEGRGVVHLGADASARIGVVSAEVLSSRITSSVRGLGLVETDPARTVIAQSRFAGFVTRLPVATPFVRVRRGQVLASIVSTELFRAEAELSTARATAGVLGTDGDALIDSARIRLGATGLSQGEVARVASGGAPRAETSVTAPRAGTVLEVRVRIGEMVTPGMPLHVIADLSRLFVNVDVPLDEAARVTVGAAATISVPGHDAPITGLVELVEPVVSTATLVRRVRVVVEQTDGVLAPGSRVDVAIARAPRDALVVPRDAVLLDGARQHVFVIREDGMYEPRSVVTGERVEERIEIVSGLREGERVASVAAFLIDAESQIRGASR